MAPFFLLFIEGHLRVILMMNTNHVEELGNFLKSCITKIKERSPHLSSNAISTKLRITNSTFNRIENLEVKRPTFDHAIKIVRAACEESEVKTFIEKYYPSMLKNFSNIYKENSDVPFVKIEAESYFEDQATFELMMMATSNNGITREVTIREFGNRGLKTLDKLLENGTLTENNGVISYSGRINASQETVQKLLLNLISLSYNLEGIDESLKNWLSLQYESVNKEKALPVASEIIHEANNKLRALFTDPKYKGEDVVWAGLVLDTLPTTTIKNEGEVLQ